MEILSERSALVSSSQHPHDHSEIGHMKSDHTAEYLKLKAGPIRHQNTEILANLPLDLHTKNRQFNWFGWLFAYYQNELQSQPGW